MNLVDRFSISCICFMMLWISNSITAQKFAQDSNSLAMPADTSTLTRLPFTWGDFTWIQGNSRQTQNVLAAGYFVGSLTIDCNYNYSFLRPIDHTTSGSTATFRSNEFNIS